MIEDIKKTLWATADKLRANMDAAEYKHLVLGLIFIKYISDSFEAHKASLTQRLRNPNDELFYGDASDADIAAGAVGLLDRVAPLCFAAPVFFHFVRWYFHL